MAEPAGTPRTVEQIAQKMRDVAGRDRYRRVSAEEVRQWADELTALSALPIVEKCQTCIEREQKVERVCPRHGPVMFRSWQGCEQCAAPPVTSPRPVDTYIGGTPMPQYAVLGIGAEAWVELQQVEASGKARRDGPRSSEIVSWRTFQSVMNVLRAVRLSDFQSSSFASPRPGAPGEVVAEAERLLKDITPGEWRLWNVWGPGTDGLMSVERIGVDDPLAWKGLQSHFESADIRGTRADLEFIAAAPRLVRQLLAALSTPPAPREAEQR